jgi:predicted component of type VI protein secretion system
VNLLSAATTPNGGQASPVTASAHVLVLNLDGQLYIRDLTGSASLQWNGKPVVEAKLRHGDQVRLGKIEYEVFATRIAAGGMNSQPTAPAAVLVPKAGGEARPMRGPVTLVGACEQADLRLLTAGAPEACAMILRLGSAYWLWNLDPASPCRLNGEPVVRAALADGSEVTIGDEVFLFQLVPQAEVKPTAAPQPVKVTKAKSPARAPVAQVDPVSPASASASVPAAARTLQDPEVAPSEVPGAVVESPAPQRGLATTVAPPLQRTPDESELEDDADVFKQWGPLAFAVASADRPELRPGGSKSGSQSSPKAPEAIIVPAPPAPAPRRSVVKVLVIVVLLALLAGGAFVAWKYGMRFLRPH